jgi:hypothetical protein
MNVLIFGKEIEITGRWVGYFLAPAMLILGISQGEIFGGIIAGFVCLFIGQE